MPTLGHQLDQLLGELVTADGHGGEGRVGSEVVRVECRGNPIEVGADRHGVGELGLELLRVVARRQERAALETFAYLSLPRAVRARLLLAATPCVRRDFFWAHLGRSLIERDFFTADSLNMGLAQYDRRRVDGSEALTAELVALSHDLAIKSPPERAAVPGVGHSMNVEAPELYAGIFGAWFGGLSF